MEQVLEQMVRCAKDEPTARALADARAHDAPQAVRDVLVALYLNQDPADSDLAALGAAALNTVFHLKKRPAIHGTLLSEAVTQRNHRWAAALLEAGADPNAKGSLMAYTVGSEGIFDPRSKPGQFKMDGRPAVPFLELYVAHGGDVRTHAGGGYGTSPLSRAPFNNMAAKMYLLENGADPWSIGPDAPNAVNFGGSLFGDLVFGARSAENNEEMYRYINAGHFRMPSDPVHQDALAERYMQHLTQMTEEAEGPENRHHLWTLQKVLRALIEQTDFVPPPGMEALLDRQPVSDAEGGWVTTADQMHLPYDAPKTGWRLGKEIW